MCRAHLSISRETLYEFGEICARYGLCHPEAKPKDLAIEREVSLARSSDPSLRSG